MSGFGTISFILFVSASCPISQEVSHQISEYENVKVLDVDETELDDVLGVDKVPVLYEKNERKAKRWLIKRINSPEEIVERVVTQNGDVDRMMDLEFNKE